MENEHAISALKRKRAELAGDLIGLDKQRPSVCQRIAHVDATLRLFGYQGDPKDIPAKATAKPRMFQRGELQRMVGAALRESGGKAKTGEIARAIIARMGWNTGDTELQTLIAGKVKDVRKRLVPITPLLTDTTVLDVLLMVDDRPTGTESGR